MIRMVLVCAVVMAACSPAPTPSTAEGADALVTSTRVQSGVPRVVDTWFDPGTARELMDAREEFDEAELRAIAEFDERMGGYRAEVSMPIQQYRDQVSSDTLRQRQWSDEQRRRSALAMGPRDAAVDAAEEELRRRTLAALKRFFAQELGAGRMSPEDHGRLVGGELEANDFPSIRRRKWAGPAVIAYRSTIRTAEYREVLQELRKLWAAQARGASVHWVEPRPSFYRSLLARAGQRAAR